MKHVKVCILTFCALISLKSCFAMQASGEPIAQDAQDFDIDYSKPQDVLRSIEKILQKRNIMTCDNPGLKEVIAALKTESMLAFFTTSLGEEVLVSADRNRNDLVLYVLAKAGVNHDSTKQIISYFAALQITQKEFQNMSF
jgi:hypothetical protein